ncbi:hypothetical protein COU58_02480 [Candidatus Pacearchaeota archaeon CG10_big_fil_rev_8_21_14_0_10_32_42]|nr:MAG: hypothetical protein COU58_02480 [Candidatus Pacearchaeota archaeon CG10_big_fil_rev_8_21_14_0_10_32_42]
MKKFRIFKMKSNFKYSIIILVIIVVVLVIFFPNKDINNPLNQSNETENLSDKNLEKRIISDLTRPFGITIHKNKLYISDFGAHKILIYDSNLNLLKTIGSFGIGKEEFDRPHSVDFDEKGNFYVTEFGNKRIQILSSEGKHITYLNSSKALEGPATGYFDKNYNFYVSDYSSNSLLKFSSDGKFIGWIGAKSDGTLTNGWEISGTSKVSSQPGGFDRLHMARVNSEGDIYVADTWNNRVQKFSSDGKFIGWIGAKSDGTLTDGWEKIGQSVSNNVEGGLNTPIAIDIIEEDNFIVFEFNGNRVQKFSSDGKFIEILEEGFNQGYDAKTYNNQLYVVDTGNKIVKIFSFS